MSNPTYRPLSHFLTGCPCGRYLGLMCRNHWMTIKVLRHFGHTISHIAICYSTILRCSNDTFDIYLTKYGLNSVKILEISDWSNWSKCYKRSLFKNIKKSFPNVRVIKIANCTLEVESLTKIFPNIESLELSGNEYKSHAVINEHFPKLKELIIRLSNRHYLPDGDELLEMLKLNPQIERLSFPINKDYGHKQIEYIREQEPELKYLFIRWYPSDSVLFKNIKPFHFNNVIDFQLKSQKLSVISAFTFSKLQRLSINFRINLNKNLNTYQPINLDDNNTYQPILDFIHKNTHLTSIEIINSVCGNLDRLFDLENILSNIEELSILHYELPDKDMEYKLMCSVLGFLQRSKTLKKLLIKVYSRLLGYIFIDGEYRGFCNAIASYCTEYKTIARRDIDYACRICRKRVCPHRFETLRYKSVEFTIKKIKDSTLIRYICTFRKEINLIGYEDERKMVMECCKIEN